MIRTIAQINEKIKKGEAVIVTAEEIIDIVEKKGVKKATQEIDVVTCATFGPMCSSGAYFNIGPTKPRLKIGGGKAHLNGIPVYTGLTAGDFYLGVTALPDEDPRNEIYPGKFRYGGGYVIEELVSGKDVKLTATAYGTDCYPRKKLNTLINLKDFNEAVLLNFRNAYQNHDVAVNLSDKTIYTYMGVLRPKLGNAKYCSAGQLSPLLNDPFYKTIGLGTRIFLGGGIGYIYWQGTQHNPGVKRGENGIPRTSAGAIAVVGDLKQMNARWLKGTRFIGYGVSLIVGIGIPIPILNEEICRYTAVKDNEIWTQVVDYSETYSKGETDSLGEVNYGQLKSGKIIVQNKVIPATRISNYAKAVEIANILKNWIKKGDFLLTEPVAHLPGPASGYLFKPLKERPF